MQIRGTVQKIGLVDKNVKDTQVDGQVDGQIDGQVDEQVDGQVDGHATLITQINGKTVSVSTSTRYGKIYRYTEYKDVGCLKAFKGQNAEFELMWNDHCTV